MSTKKTLLMILVSAFSLGLLYAYREYHRVNKDLSDAPPDYEVRDTALLREFQTDEQAAGKKYIGKIIAVTGNIRLVESSRPGSKTIILGNGPAGASVTCALDSTHFTAAGSLAVGHIATLKGSLAGFNKDETGLLGSDVLLVRCTAAPAQDRQQKN